MQRQARFRFFDGLAADQSFPCKSKAVNDYGFRRYLEWNAAHLLTAFAWATVGRALPSKGKPRRSYSRLMVHEEKSGREVDVMGSFVTVADPSQSFLGSATKL